MREYDVLKTYVENLPKNADHQDELPEDVEPWYWFIDNPKNPAELAQIETECGIIVPNELKLFYSDFSYGAVLNEYQIYTIPQLLEFRESCKWVYEESWRDSILPFANLLGVGDFLAFDLTKRNDQGYLVLGCDHECDPKEWTEICYGLREWLLRMVDSDFQPFWFPY